MSTRPRRSYRTTRADRHGRVGFYGCAVGRGELVRCVFVGSNKPPPESVKVACPACGMEHRAAPMWRPAVDADEGRVAEVVIGIGEPEERETTK